MDEIVFHSEKKENAAIYALEMIRKRKNKQFISGKEIVVRTAQSK